MLISMEELKEEKQKLLDKFHTEIAKIKNHDKLLERFHSMKDPDQLLDMEAEIEVGVHHVRKNHSVQYEPDGFSKPPEYEITSDRGFFVEVKRVREDIKMTRQKSVADDISKRIARIKRPYLIDLIVDYSKIQMTQTKEIADLIEDSLDKFNSQDIVGVKFHKILKSGEEIEFDVVKITNKPHCRKFYDAFPFSYMFEKNIIHQIKSADKKDIPSDKPFIIIVKLPDHVNEIEARGGTRGIPGIRLFIDKNSREVVAQHPIASDRVLGLTDYFMKISAVILYRHEFTSENAWLDINEKANCPVDEGFIVNNYFKCR